MDEVAPREAELGSQERSLERVPVAGYEGVPLTGAADIVATAAAVAAAWEAKKKKMKTVRVKQAYIDSLLKQYPFKPYPLEPEQLEKNIEDPETRERLHSMTATAVSALTAIRDKEEAIVRQYLVKGYAEEEIEVTDDDEQEAAA